MSEVKIVKPTQTQQVIVYQNLANATAWEVNINNVSFIPDEVVINQVVYVVAAIENFNYLVQTDLFGSNQFITAFNGQGQSLSPNLRIQPKGELKISGTYNFKVYKNATTQAVATNDAAGTLSILIQFIKY